MSGCGCLERVDGQPASGGAGCTLTPPTISAATSQGQLNGAAIFVTEPAGSGGLIVIAAASNTVSPPTNNPDNVDEIPPGWTRVLYISNGAGLILGVWVGVRSEVGPGTWFVDFNGGASDSTAAAAWRVTAHDESMPAVAADEGNGSPMIAPSRLASLNSAQVLRVFAENNDTSSVLPGALSQIVQAGAADTEEVHVSGGWEASPAGGATGTSSATTVTGGSWITATLCFSGIAS